MAVNKAILVGNLGRDPEVRSILQWRFRSSVTASSLRRVMNPQHPDSNCCHVISRETTTKRGPQPEERTSETCCYSNPLPNHRRPIISRSPLPRQRSRCLGERSELYKGALSPKRKGDARFLDAERAVQGACQHPFSGTCPLKGGAGERGKQRPSVSFTILLDL